MSTTTTSADRLAPLPAKLATAVTATKVAEMAAKLERLDKIEVFQRTAADEKLPEATRPDWTFRKGTVIVPMVPKDHASYKPGDHDYVWVEFEDVAPKGGKAQMEQFPDDGKEVESVETVYAEIVVRRHKKPAVVVIPPTAPSGRKPRDVPDSPLRDDDSVVDDIPQDDMYSDVQKRKSIFKFQNENDWNNPTNLEDPLKILELITSKEDYGELEKAYDTAWLGGGITSEDNAQIAKNIKDLKSAAKTLLQNPVNATIDSFMENMRDKIFENINLCDKKLYSKEMCKLFVTAYKGRSHASWVQEIHEKGIAMAKVSGLTYHPNLVNHGGSHNRGGGGGGGNRGGGGSHNRGDGGGGYRGNGGGGGRGDGGGGGRGGQQKTDRGGGKQGGGGGRGGQQQGLSPQQAKAELAKDF